MNPRSSTRAFDQPRRRCRLALAFLAFLLVASRPVRAQDEAPAVIADIILETRDDLPVSEIREALPWRVGEPVDNESIQRGLELLRRLPFLRSVRVDSIPTEKGEVLTVELERQRLVTEVEFSGLFPILERKAMNALRMRPGDAFNEDTLPADSKRLADLFERSGFYGTVCTAETFPDGQDVRVSHACDRGHLLGVGSVTVEGGHALSPKEIESAVRPWLFFTKEDLEKELAAEVERFSALGWVRARIQIVEITPHIEQGEVDLALSLEEGKRLVVRFEGNRVLDEDDLEPLLPFRSERGYGRFLAEQGAEGIHKAYEADGYPDAEVKFRREEGEEEVVITYQIVDGEKASLEAVRFEGNRSIDTDDLRKAISTGRRRWLVLPPLWNEELLASDRAAIEQLYRSRGFADASVAPVEKERVAEGLVVVFRIEEGPVYELADIAEEGAPAALPMEPEVKRKLHPGDLYVAEGVEQERLSLERALQGAGYLSGRVRVKEDRVPAQGRVGIIFLFEPGPRYRSSAIFTMGTAHVSDSLISRDLAVKSGEILTPNAIADTQANLRSLDVFDSIQLTPVGLETGLAVPGGPDEARVPVLLRVRERPRIQVDVGFGYDTDRGASGTLSAAHLNLFGSAIKLTAEGKFGQRDRLASLTIADPRLFLPGLRGSSFASYNDQTFEAFDEAQFKTGGSLSRKLPWNLTSKIDLTRRVATISNVTSQSPLAPREGTTRDLLWSASLARDTRDDLLYPTRGAFVSAATTLSAHALLSDDDFVRLDLQARGYRALTTGVVGVLAATFTDVEIYGSTRTVPTPELLFTGGANSVRGFPVDRVGPLDAKGNPLGGGTRIVANAELRFPLVWILEGAVFVDTGSITADLGGVAVHNFESSVGSGIRARSPVGPIRFDVAAPLENKSPLDRWAIAFSFGYPF